MTQTLFRTFSRWRTLLAQLWRAAGWRVALQGLLLVVTAVLPAAVIVASGSLVAGIPAAVEHGVSSAAGRPALLALGGLVLAMVAATFAGLALGLVTRTVNTLYAMEVYRTVARVSLGSPGVAPLEDPAFAVELQAIQEADRRGVIRGTASYVNSVVGARLTGIAQLALLLAFRWWAPLLLAAGWHLANRVFAKATERGVLIDVTEGAVRQREAEYLRGLVLEPVAAKENRVFGLGGWTVGRYADAWHDSLRLMWQHRGATRGLALAATGVLLLAHAAVLGALALAAARGEIGAGALVVFVQATVASAGLGLIGELLWWISQSLGMAERLSALRARAGDHLLPLASPHVSAAGAGAGAAPARRAVAVRLEGVRFAYRGRPRPALDGLELEIPAGQSLAIVGENGAGKSTLIKILCGLYDPDAGRVLVDGAAPLEARGRIGVIFQDFVRYKLPLRENVGFGHLPLMGDTAALEAALRDAGGAELLRRLPGGWDTVLAREFTDGADLSGGEWQRVALARALTAVRGGAGLLILDEPTASLDVRAETELFERFLELTRGVTTVLVSHRLSSVRRADRIVVLDGGRVAEDGSHEELMAAGGIYATMFSLQAERFAAAETVRGEEVVHA